MRPTLFVATMLCAPMLALPWGAVRAQTGDTTSGPSLTMDEAIRLAIQNNPAHLSVVDARRNATAAKRAAWGAFLPTANASFGTSYQQSGNIPLSGNLFNVGSDIYQSSYWLGLTYTLNAATFINPRMQSANVRAADADIAGSAETVRSMVAQDYLTVLQDRAKAVLQDTLVSQADIQLQLAQAKLAVGSGTVLDVTKAQVTLGQAKVALLQAKNQVEIDKLRLFQEMGVPEPANVDLTSTFEVKAPTFTVDSVLAIARDGNPALHALESRDKVASLGVSQARSSYLPTLQLSTGLGGYTYQYSNANVLVQGAQFQTQSGLAQCATSDSVRLRVGMPLLGTSCTSSYQFNNTIANQIRAQNNQ
ncbi:MAG: TolC family protein, partial [Gemmatimonadaceae bacterium]